jgi:rubrerythrin
VIGWVVTLGLAAAALAYVLTPVRTRRGAVVDEAVEGSEEARAKKAAALAGIVDIEIEREIGRLSEGDFYALRREYEVRAVEAMHEEDAAGASDDDVIEREVAEARKRLTCPTCGVPRTPGEQCPRCD